MSENRVLYKMNLKRNGLIFLMILFSGIIRAQKEFNLQDCMIYACENALENKKTKIENKIYRQNVSESYASFLPSVSLGTSADYTFGRSLDPETNTYQIGRAHV